MRVLDFSQLAVRLGIFVTIFAIGACGFPDPPNKEAVIPPAYAKNHMPEGWWNDQGIIEEGRLIYVGSQKPGVNCAKCHGKNGKPVKSGARDFRHESTMKKYSDSYLLWRISEGVPFSQMRAFKERLSQEEMWKVIAFLSTLGMDGYQYDAETNSWVPYPKA